MRSQEVSRAHSIRQLAEKERTQSTRMLHPQYIAGFVDGEGSFSVSIYKDKTMKCGVYVKPEFEIELRADDREILERIRDTLGCGTVYECNYARYGWYPHVKYKVMKTEELANILIPFFEKHLLQAKKQYALQYFKEIVERKLRGEHLSHEGLQNIRQAREKLRELGKKHRTVGNR